MKGERGSEGRGRERAGEGGEREGEGRKREGSEGRAGEEWQGSEGEGRGVKRRGMRGRAWGVTGEGRGGRWREEE